MTLLPVLAYQPETSLIFGAGAAIVLGDSSEQGAARPDNVGLFAMYTLKNQVILAVAPDLYAGDGGEWQLRFPFDYKKFPDSYFGTGGDTREEDEEVFTTESVQAELVLMRRIIMDLRVGLKCHWTRSSLIEVEDGGMLESARKAPGTIPGAGNWTQFGIGGVIDRDTRDNIFATHKGSWYQFHAVFYRGALGSDFDYDFYKLDLRKFFEVRPEHIVAFLLYGEERRGSVPFTELAHLGRLRGILEGRFRDMSMGMAQVDYRFPLDNVRLFGRRLPYQDRLSGAVFVAAGDVSGSIDNFGFDDLKYSYGFGFRFAIDRANRMKVRFDLGFSETGIYPYFQINESF